MLDEINRLPDTERQFAVQDRYVERHAIEHRFDVRGHVVRSLCFVDPRRIFWRYPVKRGNQIQLHIGIGIFLDRKGRGCVAKIDEQHPLAGSELIEERHGMTCDVRQSNPGRVQPQRRTGDQLRSSLDNDR